MSKSKKDQVEIDEQEAISTNKEAENMENQENIDSSDQSEESPESPSTEHTEQAQEASQLTKLESERDELKDKYLRLVAEFDNFKKRAFKEKLETINTASRETLTSLLPILDDFDRAKNQADDESSEEHFSEGVSMVYNKLYSTLNNIGLAEMKTNGEVFNPDLHDAITEIPAPSEDMKGKIIDTVEKGYKLRDKIIRHAKVVVGK